MDEQGNIDCLVRNETKHIAGHSFLICCSSDLKQKVEALSTPGSRCICLIATGPLLSGAARVSAPQRCGKIKKWSGSSQPLWSRCAMLVHMTKLN